MVSPNGVPPFKFFWSTGDTSNSISDLCGGDYAVTVIDSLGCIYSDTIEILQSSQILAHGLHVIPASCPNCDDGCIYLDSISGGIAPYWTLFFPDTFNFGACALYPGTYHFRFCDYCNGCTEADSVVIGVSNSLNELNSTNTFTLTPNPATTTLTITTNANTTTATAQIFTIEGKAATQKIPLANTNTVIDIAQLPKGLYLVTLQSNAGYAVKKFVKE